MNYRAPGRVNIIGEHTDYNDGFVLPTTTAAYTQIQASARDDRCVHLASSNLGKNAVFDLDDTDVNDPAEWSDYARGVAVEIEAHGITLSGANLTIDGDIPIGGGLSSSASFEVGVAVALLDLAGQTLAPLRIAQLCQLAEIRYAGVNCGIMDQYSIAACEQGKAMLIDCRSLSAGYTTIPPEARLLVVDSGVRHQLPESGYNTRGSECAEAVAVLATRRPGITALRDVTLQDIESAAGELGDLLVRRSRHVVTENARVLAGFDALGSGDLQTLGQLIQQSHSSQRDDFEISCEAVDKLVAIADSCEGALGARQVGGGFGGCVLCLTTEEHLESVRDRIVEDYGKLLGSTPWTHVVSAAAAASKVEHL